MGINNVVLTGRLGDDAILKYSSSGTAICDFSIAVEFGKKQGDEWINEVFWVKLALFGERAESLYPYLVKGKEVGITGHLENDQWEQDGKKHSRLVVKAEKISLLAGGGKKSETGESGVEQKNEAEADPELVMDKHDVDMEADPEISMDY
jgi:single-strand DNA-binding protein